MSASPPTRVAVVGTGWWGAQHARAFSEDRDVELCAVVGRTPERVAPRAARHGARPYVDLAEMLAVERPDLVSLCLPNTEHFAPTLQVIEAGVGVLVEKPLVFDLDEADQLLAAAAERQLVFAIAFNHRYAPAVERARAAVEAGRVGDVVFASWRFGGEGTSQHHPYANLIETQGHGFDLLEQLCGPIATVSAELSDAGGDAGPGTVVASLRFASGAVGSLVGSYRSSYAYSRTHALEVNGTAGRVLVDDTVAQMSYQAAGDEVAEVWQAGYFNDRDRTFTTAFDRLVRATVRAFRAGEPPPVPAAAGRRALALAWAAVESWDTGRRVVVPSR